MNILLVAEESAGTKVLKMLHSSEHRVVGVLTSPEREDTATSVWSLAKELGYHTMPASDVKDPGLVERVKAHAVDILLNIHSLYIIHRDNLGIPTIGSFNLHPGPLPRYAGLNTPSWAIARGETEYGVTLHHMVPEVDTGPIAYQVMFPIEETETGLSLYVKCIRNGISLVERLLASAAEDPTSIPSLPQDRSRREYFGSSVPNSGMIRWESSAREVCNFVRAFDYFPFTSPWGQAYTLFRGERIDILRVRKTGEPSNVSSGYIGGQHKNEIAVATLDEWVNVCRVRWRGKVIDAAEVLVQGEVLGH